MTELFIGWDVGAWHCDKGTSRDALCVLEGTSRSDLRLAAKPWRGNLREVLSDPTPAGPDVLLTRVGVVPSGVEATIGIDATLGWPRGLRLLLEPGSPQTVVESTSSGNPYVYRQTERLLFVKGFRPLSAVRDMIGSQSTKALHFLHRAGFVRTDVPGVWTTGHWTGIEVYPRTCRNSDVLRPTFRKLRAEPAFDEVARTDSNAQLDCEDALLCALMAALWRFERRFTDGPPERADAALTREGWTWTPSDGQPGEPEHEVEA